MTERTGIGSPKRAARMALATMAVVAGHSLSHAQTAPDETVYGRLNHDLVERHILPRYRDFAAATDSLADAASACTTAPAPFAAAYERALDAWMAIEQIRLGPAALDMRNERIQFWPDRRNTGGRQYEQLLAQRPADITSQSLRQGSVALQGFPALERILFSESADGLDAFECGLAEAIADNLATIAADLVSDWAAPGGDAAMIASAGSPDSFYASQRDVAADIYQGLYEFLEIIKDQKLARPLGEVVEQANPRRAESWRSGRSLRNIEINLQAALDLFAGGDGFGFEDALAETGHADLASAIRIALELALSQAESIDPPLADAIVDVQARADVEALLAAVDHARDLIGAEMGAALGLTMGFNSLDGD